MKVYLVWERESYCDYDVINIFTDEEKAKKFVEIKKQEHKHSHIDGSKAECDCFWYEERIVGVEIEGNW